MQELTKRQAQVFNFVMETTIENNGKPPSTGDIMKHFSFKSPNAVTMYKRILIKKGYLEQARFIKVIDRMENLIPRINTIEDVDRILGLLVTRREVIKMGQSDGNKIYGNT